MSCPHESMFRGTRMFRSFAFPLTFFPFVLPILLSGCTSYRVVGRVPSANVPVQQPLMNTYRLERVKVEYDNIRRMQTLAWCLEFALGEIPVNDFEERIARKRPDVFNNDASSIPITAPIRFLSRNESLAWTILVPYIVSFGTLPAILEVDDVAGLTVQRRDTMQTASEAKFSFQHKMKLTCFSPFALINFNDDPDATVCVKDNGIMQNPALNPQVRDRIADAIAETLAAAIILRLRVLEALPLPAPVAHPPSIFPSVPSPVPAAASTPPAVVPVAPVGTVSPTQGPAPNSIPLDEQIGKLRELRDSGIITAKEYEDLLFRMMQRKD